MNFNSIKTLFLRNIPPTYFPSAIAQKILPSWIAVEPINLCNLRCPFCSWNSLKRQRGFLSYDNFRYIIATIPSLKGIALFFKGEPLLNKELFQMVSYAESKNIKTAISTNSTLLHERAEAILQSGLSKIQVCLDGLSQETLQQYRKGADCNVVIQGIERLCNLKRQRGSSHPRIILRFLVFRHNENEIDDVINLAKNLEVDTLLIGRPLLDFKNPCVNSELAERWLPKTAKYGRYEKIENGYCLKNRVKHCPSVWTPTITWDGEVLPCCIDGDANFSLGNLFDKPFTEIYWSKEYAKRRKLMWSKKLPLCEQCTLTAPKMANIEYRFH